MKISGTYVVISAIACILACLGGFAAMLILGAYYPGYSQMKDTISALGASASPVSDQISICWIIVGVILIFFGTGFYSAFSEKGRFAGIASWMIILYGLGEEIGSGAFKANHSADGPATSALIHNAIGGIGVAAVLLLPLVMQKVIAKNEMPGFIRLSKIVFFFGIVSILLFLFRYSLDENNFFAINKGLWQRLFVLDIYVYFVVIAILMIKKIKHQTGEGKLKVEI